jgi:multisubunit Na+/H+ antiporter MnhE subunit
MPDPGPLAGEPRDRKYYQPRLARAGTWLVWWVLLMSLWVMLDDSLATDELLVGAGAAAIAALVAELATYLAFTARDDLPAAVVGYTCHGLVSIKPDRSLGGGCMSRQHQTSRRENSTPGPERPSWLFLVTGGLVYAGALLGMWIVLAGQPDAQDLAVGSVAAVLAVSVGYLLSQRGKMVPSVRAADLRTLAAVPWQVVVETGQVFALAARKASGRPAAPGALHTVPLDAGPDVRGWPAARREAVLTALLSAAPNTVVVDIDMEAGTALVHQLAGAPQPDARPAPPG